MDSIDLITLGLCLRILKNFNGLKPRFVVNILDGADWDNLYPCEECDHTDIKEGIKEKCPNCAWEFYEKNCCDLLHDLHECYNLEEVFVHFSAFGWLWFGDEWDSVTHYECAPSGTTWMECNVCGAGSPYKEVDCIHTRTIRCYYCEEKHDTFYECPNLDCPMDAIPICMITFPGCLICDTLSLEELHKLKSGSEDTFKIVQSIVKGEFYREYDAGELVAVIDLLC